MTLEDLFRECAGRDPSGNRSETLKPDEVLWFVNRQETLIAELREHVRGLQLQSDTRLERLQNARDALADVYITLERCSSMTAMDRDRLIQRCRGQQLPPRPY